jgi:hypothetical protein
MCFTAVRFKRLNINEKYFRRKIVDKIAGLALQAI